MSGRLLLSRLQFELNRATLDLMSNPYRVHQRLWSAYEGDPRLLFRIEELMNEYQLLVQSHLQPDMMLGFGDLPRLSSAACSGGVHGHPASWAGGDSPDAEQ